MTVPTPERLREIRRNMPLLATDIELDLLAALDYVRQWLIGECEEGRELPVALLDYLDAACEAP